MFGPLARQRFSITAGLAHFLTQILGQLHAIDYLRALRFMSFSLGAWARVAKRPFRPRHAPVFAIATCCAVLQSALRRRASPPKAAPHAPHTDIHYMTDQGSTSNRPYLSNILKGKRGLVLGVANNKSIAWGVAKACADAGAELALTFQVDALEKRVRPLAQELGAHVVGRCDVTETDTVDAIFAEVEKLWGKLDFVVHCLAFSDKDQLTGRYVDTTAENFRQSLDISCYSFTALAQRAEKLMTDGGSLLTLTYYGAEKWMPHYNVMGVAKAALEASVRYLAADLGVKNIRVNAISAGPIKTLAASGIGDFRYILRWNEYNSPLRRVVTIEEVGETAVYLLSPMARGVSGEIVHVDAGYHVVGMMNPSAAPKMADLLALLPQER
jgi:enoyl-[acyl-carrier protein] reductase I